MSDTENDRVYLIPGRIALACHITGYSLGTLAHQLKTAKGNLGNYGAGAVRMEIGLLISMARILEVTSSFFTEEKITITIKGDKIIKVT